MRPVDFSDDWIQMVQKPKSFTVRPEGTMQLSTAPDGSVTTSSDKPVYVDLGHIDAIGIRNLVDVESHQITRVAGLTSHYIRLFGGGEVILAFNEQGEIVECSGLGVLSQIVNGRELVFSKKPA